MVSRTSHNLGLFQVKWATWPPTQTAFTKVVSHGCVNMTMIITLYNDPPPDV